MTAASKLTKTAKKQLSGFYHTHLILRILVMHGFPPRFELISYSRLLGIAGYRIQVTNRMARHILEMKRSV